MRVPIIQRATGDWSVGFGPFSGFSAWFWGHLCFICSASNLRKHSNHTNTVHTILMRVERKRTEIDEGGEKCGERVRGGERVGGGGTSTPPAQKVPFGLLSFPKGPRPGTDWSIIQRATGTGKCGLANPFCLQFEEALKPYKQST